jgi:type II secretory pathway pseudopilin PulG
MKKNQRKGRRAITLIEIMIVIFLIGIIGGTLAFNMRGSMDQGRAFKTEQTIARVHDILMLEYASTDKNLDEIAKEWKDILSKSPLVNNKGKDLLTDGWKKDLKVEVDTQNEDLVISSEKLDSFTKKNEGKG